ncbi:MAG: D-alanine-D-alanine ligase [Planctomycetota bacterium]|jgi:D-alanine-D-alanine ligase
MRKLRVLAITHESLVPPENPTADEIEKAPWKMDYDVLKTLQELGHTVKTLGMSSELGPIREAIKEFNPHIAFNLLDEFDGEILFDQNVVSYLELLGVPYTGCNPRGLILGRDKALSKKLLYYHRIPVPDFAVFRRGMRVKKPKKLEYPLIVKSLIEQASAGISQASVVSDDNALAERVKFIHEKIGTDAIAESFIEGRELYVGIVGNKRLQVFPVWELQFGNMAGGASRIATAKVKFDIEYQKKREIKNVEASGIPEETLKKIQRICKRVYRVLDLNGYARIDIRLRNDGKPFILEANPNPQIAWRDEFAESAEKAGLSYPELIQKLLGLGLRWQPRRSKN